MCEVRHRDRVRDDGDREPVVEHVDDRQADPVDRDRALLDDVAQQVAVAAHAQVGGADDDLADAVDVALHEVPAEAVGQADRALEVHLVARLQVAEARALQASRRTCRRPTRRRRTRRR